MMQQHSIRSRQSRTGRRRRAFTLTELLTVICIIALLASILFPVFAIARGKGRQAMCMSNLRQIGLAVRLYTQDYDDLLPYALDASDVDVTSIWASQPAACYAAIKQMKSAGQILYYHHPASDLTRWVPGILDPYIGSREVWHCLSDTGFDVLDNNDNCPTVDSPTGGSCPMAARPTMYDSNGSSYLWRTSLGVTLRSIDTLYGIAPDGSSFGPEGINIVFDGNGSWHGSPFSLGRSGLRYTTLFADGHVKLLTWADYNRAWETSITTHGAGPCP